MDILIKKILDELIQYRTERKADSYLKNAYEKMGDEAIVQLIGWLLLWQKQVFLELEKPEMLNISDVLYTRYVEFFKNCPSLNKIFLLHKDYIGWASALTQEEQDEIRNYIHVNYQARTRIRQQKK